MDISDSENSETGSSLAPQKADASYFRGWHTLGFDPNDETLLKFEAVVPAETVEQTKDAPSGRCNSAGLSVDEESQVQFVWNEDDCG